MRGRREGRRGARKQGREEEEEGEGEGEGEGRKGFTSESSAHFLAHSFIIAHVAGVCESSEHKKVPRNQKNK